MGLFDLFRRKRRAVPAKSESRIDYLLTVLHDQLEAPKDAFGGVNFLAFVERQLVEGPLYLALWNIANQVKDCFQLANLYWGQGDMDRAESYLRQTLERHRRLMRAMAEHGEPVRAYNDIEYAKAAACLLGSAEEVFPTEGGPEHCYEPWFINTLLDRCLDAEPFDMAAWAAASDAWTRKRHPRYRLEEFGFYVKALTGEFASTGEMFKAHEAMFTGRAKRSPDADLLAGYRDNDLIIDFVFAAVLKRIGWQGTYRHSWPGTGVVGSEVRTSREPDRYLDASPAPLPQPDADSGVIADAAEARRFIDAALAGMPQFEDYPADASRPAKARSKVSGELAKLGWTNDLASLDLMRTYRMDCIPNANTHISLCDPLPGAAITLRDWTQLLVGEFDLHPDFIAIAGSEDRSDYGDPQGRWYVYWKQDKWVYAVERDDWGRPDIATRDARVGLTCWPSYCSFVAWWVSEHLRATN
jgi:hypothetical protein